MPPQSFFDLPIVVPAKPVGHRLRSLSAALVVLSAIAFSAPATNARAGDIPTDYEAETARFRTALDDLAGWCRQKQLVADEKRVATWLPSRAADKSYFFLVDSKPEDESSLNAEFARLFRALREEHAAQLFALARRAAKEEEYSAAVKFVYETLREQPLHAEALKLLGYQVVGRRRLSPYELAKQRAGYVWHDQFGWLKEEHVKRYEGGERYLSGKWVTAAEDARIHATPARPWVVDTENFRIETNHSLEEGVRLAARLEKMTQVWRQLFARYHTSEAEWKRLFDGGAPRRDPSKKPYVVVYYRTRDEYVAALVKQEPMVGITTGIFMNAKDTAYFYAAADQNNDPILFHETTHQLFALTKRTLNVGVKGNFWIVEGIACQMESLVLHEHFAELGGSDNPRMNAARYRLLETKFYVPLVEFTALGRDQMQKDPRLPMLYSQASGLASFLMYGENGKYREATVDYLDAIYTNKDNPLTLTQRTGRSFEQLDADYQRYIKALPAPAPKAD